jgi:hypothetical protein
MLKTSLLFVLALFVATHAAAQGKKRIEKAADMPRFTYKVEGKLEDLVRDEKAFSRFAAEVKRDNQSVLDGYEIADQAAHRDLLAVQAQIDFLEGRYAEAARRAEEIRALEEKPADKLISGMAIRTMVAARAKVGDTTSEAYRREVGRLVAAELAGFPYPVVANDIKGYKSSAEVIGEALVLGSIRDRLQPVVDKADGALSSDFAPAIVRSRFALVTRLPLKQTLIDTYGTYLAANKVEKPDIWATRDVELPAGRKYAPVKVAVWDSGVDAPIFKDRLVTDRAGKPLFIAFDVYEEPSKSELMPIPAALRSRIPEMKSRMKGLSDLQSNIDSPEAGLRDAFASAPEILFVAAAGNSNADAAFEEAIPADIVLPNLLTVGAVDKAGDEAPFTSYGPTVKAHANGYQVDSYLPGGERVAFSGTSMASPQVAGLAAKMLAVNPKLKPAGIIAIILGTVEKTADGRRFLVHPGNAVTAAKAKTAS